MYLGSELVRAGLDVKRSEAPNGRGPDFIISHVCGQISIEAVCPGPGDEPNPERVPPLVHSEAGYRPDEEMTLRIRRSIVEDKAQSFREYLHDGVILPDCRNVVAVSCSKLGYPGVGVNVLAGSVLPIGPVSLSVRNESDEAEVGFARKTRIVRQSGHVLSTTGFIDGTLSHIAAAIFYPGTLFNGSYPADRLHSLRNPTARFELPSGVLPVEQEWKW
jgi:hypothetical protein